MAKTFRFSTSLGNIDPAEIAPRSQRAEELGYSAVSISDHFWAQPAPLIGLTAAAMATTTLRVIPLVLANDYREPLVLAKELATLDSLSGGRLEFGIGAGWLTVDYEESGIQLDSPGTRIRRLSEAVDIFRGLLGGEAVDVQGEFYNITATLTEPLPVQATVPLMLAGGKQKMLTLAGAKGDIVGYNPGLTAGVIDERAGRNATAEKTDEKMSWIRDGAGERFDDLELQSRTHAVVITDDRDGVAAEFAPLLGITPEEALASPHALIGTVDQCIDELQRWRDRWGISYVSVGNDEMEAFAPVVEALAGK